MEISAVRATHPDCDVVTSGFRCACVCMFILSYFTVKRGISSFFYSFFFFFLLLLVGWSVGSYNCSPQTGSVISILKQGQNWNESSSSWLIVSDSEAVSRNFDSPE